VRHPTAHSQHAATGAPFQRRLARVHEDTATGLLRPGRRLEDIVSKRRDLPYRSGRCRAWVKIKNPASPAVLRIQDGTW
jgi:ATP-dependent DNA ligase